MSVLPIFNFLLILAGVVNGRTYRYDYKYSQKANGWLKFHQIPATWNDARVLCHAEGAVLLSPIDDNISSEMERIMALQNVSCGLFTGIHASFAKGVFSSLQGVPLSKISVAWAPDEPDNFNNSEDCLMMLANGTLADVKCEDVFPFICYREKSRKNIMTGCGTVDNQYTLDPRTGSCYKFHVVGQTWSNAFMTCASEGGYLAIINSDTEALVLKELFVKYPQNVIYSKHKNSAFLGYVEWTEKSDWFTIYGDTLQEAGYTVWAGGQPDNFQANGKGQHCGGMFRDAKLDDIWCDDNVAFICEKSPDSLIEDDLESQ